MKKKPKDLEKLTLGEKLTLIGVATILTAGTIYGIHCAKKTNQTDRASEMRIEENKANELRIADEKATQRLYETVKGTPEEKSVRDYAEEKGYILKD